MHTHWLTHTYSLPVSLLSPPLTRHLLFCLCYILLTCLYVCFLPSFLPTTLTTPNLQCHLIRTNVLNWLLATLALSSESGVELLDRSSLLHTLSQIPVPPASEPKKSKEAAIFITTIISLPCFICLVANSCLIISLFISFFTLYKRCVSINCNHCTPAC